LNETLIRAARPRGQSAQHLQSGSPAIPIACVARPRVEAVALLSHVVAHLHGFDVPVVQFIQVSPYLERTDIARAFAEASLTRLGRTLLASVYDRQPLQNGLIAGSAQPNLARRRRTQKTTIKLPEIEPDASLSGLYHARIGFGNRESDTASQAATETWLGEARVDFRALVIDCGPLERNPTAVELASRCHGSILTVAAGITRLEEIRTTAHQLQVAGGTLIGTVLYGMPSVQRVTFSSWMRCKLSSGKRT
jgi:hypothetical protein